MREPCLGHLLFRQCSCLCSCCIDGEYFFLASFSSLLTFLQSKVYLKAPGQKFWDEVDSSLAKIRKQASGDCQKITSYVLSCVPKLSY